MHTFHTLNIAETNTQMYNNNEEKAHKINIQTNHWYINCNESI